MTIEQRLGIIRAAKHSVLMLADDTSTSSLTTGLLQGVADILWLVIEDMERERAQQESNHQTPPSQ